MQVPPAGVVLCMDELPLCGETVLTGEAFPFHPCAGILAGWVYQPHTVPPRLCVDSYWVALTNLSMDFVKCPLVLPVLVTMFVCQTAGVTLKTRLESFTETCYLETITTEALNKSLRVILGQVHRGLCRSLVFSVIVFL